ncbi:putative mitochondrial chaperone protein DNAj [Leptomonas pyrrhocoris]|uniref:Putative mitochondrial chaperone protein DNAj n=1 Tax=Leptomonas pyrrhocoris TaxID=157538 RepID=A0A0N0DV09_LEPPY|nr:putative mitochondrial chaperone protein DNAj [Leptomonas pyrrhocoris]KPA79664.1 putative mitochondrial chaperone protein DNAj [Leptomonas pyrrhocoris]|eukprot:XP_015658103.1 putative mitochondrial chaperone protein DNAj [Leptomonas pyrrhocoris]
MFLRRLPCGLATAIHAHVPVSTHSSIVRAASFSLWTPRRCGATAPAPPTSSSSGKGNYFAFFSLEKHPEVDVAALQKLYHDLQRRVHPDQQQVQQREQQEQQRQQQQQQAKSPAPCVPDANALQSSVDVSTYANAAYEALRSPYSRCRYLSRLVKAQEVKGAVLLTPAEEEELMIEDDRRTMQARETCPDAPMDEDFLMEMLTMSELIFGGDAKEEAVRRQWAVLRADLEDRAVGYFKDAVKHWSAGDMAQFHHTVQEWTYVNNALNNVKERLLQCA